MFCLGVSPDQYDVPAETGFWELSPSAWELVDVVDGQVYKTDGTKWPMIFVEAFDPEELRAVGTWRGSKSDRELLRWEKELAELRQDIEPDADQSIDLELSVASRVRKAVKAIGQAIIEEHAEATTYEGEKVADVLSELRQDVEEDAGAEQPEDPVEEIDVERALAEGAGEAVEQLEALQNGQ